MGSAVETLLERIIMERIEQILRQDPEEMRQFCEKEDAVMKCLDGETKGLFMKFADDVAGMNMKDYEAVYKAAFLDGLCLGRLAFGQER